MSNKDVEILFSTPKKWHLSSQIIKWALGSSFSHVCLKINSSFYERDLIYEASAGQVQTEKFENWEERNKILYRYEVNVSDLRKKEIIQYSIDHLRYKYGVLSLVAIFFKDKFGIKLPFGVDGDRKFICSEFIFLCMKDELVEMAQKQHIQIDEEADYIDPTEVHAILKNQGKLQKVLA